MAFYFPYMDITRAPYSFRKSTRGPFVPYLFGPRRLLAGRENKNQILVFLEEDPVLKRRPGEIPFFVSVSCFFVVSAFNRN